MDRFGSPVIELPLPIPTKFPQVRPVGASFPVFVIVFVDPAGSRQAVTKVIQYPASDFYCEGLFPERYILVICTQTIPTQAS